METIQLKEKEIGGLFSKIYFQLVFFDTKDKLFQM